ncbi:discoidin domain-containing protein [Micromonospora sp. NPDC051296]|uniref:FIMAH domain-containing protein n=1 Tax=Micromonospora sp. NPDC051296 TaxID=3155046 RepID=UPI00342D6E00
MKILGRRTLTGGVLALVCSLLSTLAPGTGNAAVEPAPPYTVPVDLALGSAVENIKVSSIRAGSTPEAVFRAGTSQYWDVDRSQSTASAIAAGKNRFWVAVDLGDEKAFSQFVVAFQTNFTELKERVSEYRVEYTSDAGKWNELSTTARAGAAGLEDYRPPRDWTIAAEQDTADLVDGNGNKTMVHTMATPVTARYVMLTGEMKLNANFIRIFNFMVLTRVTAEPPPDPNHPTENVVDIVPDHPGMSLTIGRPALVEQGGPMPRFNVVARKRITIGGVIRNPRGDTVHTVPQRDLDEGAQLVVAPSVTADSGGTYVAEFEIGDGDKRYFDTYYFTAVPGANAHGEHNPYPAVQVGSDGRLVYTPDHKGNRVVDYSNVGFKGGGVAIPNVPVKIILEPVGGGVDDYQRLQQAIDTLSQLKPDKDGFRGALLLKAGTYRTSRTLEVGASGIVIKGEGPGTVDHGAPPITPDNWYDYAQSEEFEPAVTKLVATWRSTTYDKNTPVINVAGSSTADTGAPAAVVDQYVPAGAHTIRLANTDGLRPGDTVVVNKAVNRAWVHDLYMDAITDYPGGLSANQWSDDLSYWDNLDQERTIKAVDQARSTITIEEPLVDALDMKYGTATVRKLIPTGRIQGVGVENIQLISRFDKSVTGTSTAFGTTYKQYEDELHAQVGVRFSHAENVWVRNYTTYHIDVGVSVNNGVRWLTVQDANVVEFVSKTTAGERRYGISISGGTGVLVQRAFARYARHAYVLQARVTGPYVFHDSTALYNMDASEPHLRWSAGGLFDQMNARIYVQNRWSNGTAHGWAGVNYTLWNNHGPYMISQPPLAANYLFGQSAESPRVPFIMENVDPGYVPNFPAYEYGNGAAVTPDSLFLHQLADRLGAGAVRNISSTVVPDYIDESDTVDTRIPKLAGIYLDGEPLSGFDPDVTRYTVAVPLDNEAPALTAVGEEGSIVSVTEPDDHYAQPYVIAVDAGTDIDGRYTVAYDMVPKHQRVTASHGAGTVANLLDGNKDTVWDVSSSTGASARFYLGDSPRMVDRVSIGFAKNTQSRRQYYFDIDVSVDGVTWHRVLNPTWQLDNLGHGHIMSHQVLPGAETSLEDVEEFLFEASVEARLVRITGYGSRDGTGTGTSTSNRYFSVEIGGAELDGAITVVPVDVSTFAGRAPVLPTEVTVRNRDGSSVSVAVEWDGVDPGRLEHPGRLTVGGRVDGVSLRALARITVTAPPGTAAIRELIGEYRLSGDLGGPLATQLGNALASADHHAGKGSFDTAARHLEVFLRHLGNPPLQGHVSETARSTLASKAEELLGFWSSGR